MSYELVVGVGVGCFLLIYASFKFSKEHVFLSILLFSVALSAFTIVPKHLVDEAAGCELVLLNTTVSGSNETFYNYGSACLADTSNSRLSFYRFWTRIVLILYFTYMFVALSYYVLTRFTGIGRKGRRKR